MAIVVVLRRPESLTAPGFWADDAPFYTHALAGGSLLEPYGGYLVIPQRAVMALASLFPPATAPLFANLISIGVAVAVAGLLLIRLRQPWLALGFVLLPGTRYVLGTLVDIQWVLGVYVLIVAAAPKLRDAVPIFLVALQGPIALLLAPLFAARWWCRRDNGAVLLALAIGAAIQGLVILGIPRHPSGEYSELAMAITWRGVVVPTLGFTLPSLGPPPLAISLLALPIAALLLVAVRGLGGWGIGLVYLWAVFLAAGTILSPYDSHAIWTAISLTERHFYLVGVAVAAAVILGAQLRAPAALALLPLLLAAMAFDFRLPALGQTWAENSRCIGGPEPCTVMTTDGWQVDWVPR
jgi:hypothetical protein